MNGGPLQERLSGVGGGTKQIHTQIPSTIPRPSDSIGPQFLNTLVDPLTLQNMIGYPFCRVTEGVGLITREQHRRFPRNRYVLTPRAALIIFDRFVPLQGAEWSTGVLTLTGLWGGVGGSEMTVRATSVGVTDTVTREERELVGE